MTAPDGKKVLSFCTVNFTRHEEMASFEQEFNKAVESLKEDAKQ